MFGCETGYAITQDYTDAGEAPPPSLEVVQAAVYGLHTYEPRRHSLGLTAALHLLKEEGKIGLDRTVIGVFRRKQAWTSLLIKGCCIYRLELHRLALRSLCKPSSLGQALVS